MSKFLGTSIVVAAALIAASQVVTKELSFAPVLQPEPASPVSAQPHDAVWAKAPQASARIELDHQVLASAAQCLVMIIEMHQDNIANARTIGFKRSTAYPTSLGVMTVRAPGMQQDATGTPSPLGIQIGRGSQLRNITVVHSQGSLENSGRKLDIAIDGQGFLQVIMSDGSVSYTRDGHLQVNADGKLVTCAGMIIVPEITLPQDLLDISIGRDGRVTGRTGGSPDTTTNFGQLQLVKFINPNALLRDHDGVYRASAASGHAVQGSPGASGFGSLRQSFLERSNVQMMAEMFRLGTAQRELKMIHDLLFGH